MHLAYEFQENGFVTLEKFFSSEELQLVISEINQIENDALKDLKEKWHDQKVTFFTTLKDNEEFVTTKYFQDSAHNNHIFFENTEDSLVINRIGHNLHNYTAESLLHKKVYDNPVLNDALKATGLVHPHCLLSVFIPKYPNGHGSDVKPHQESSFAHTTPLSSKVLWVALEDATIENACMWGLPKSHKMPLKYVSIVEHEKRKRVYQELSDVEIPQFNKEVSPYIPLEVKAGDALLFDGSFVHCSPQNFSDKTRRAISFQFIETHNTTFSPFNWIKDPSIKRLY